MSATAAAPHVLRTTAGDFALHEYRLGLGGRVWRILHSDAVLSRTDELRFLSDRVDGLPYGVALWPAAIALAHDIAARPDLAGCSVLELGAGTGLPGIVAASLGARVVQTDRQELAMSVCRRNAERNRAAGIEHRLADWTAWNDTARYDWIIGSDVFYGESMHPHLRRIFDSNLAPGGRLLLSDPFRATGLRLLEAMEADGWPVSLTRWSVGEENDRRPIGVFELQSPRLILGALGQAPRPSRRRLPRFRPARRRDTRNPLDGAGAARRSFIRRAPRAAPAPPARSPSALVVPCPHAPPLDPGDRSSRRRRRSPST